MTETLPQANTGAKDEEPVVLVVDDDASLRSVVSSLLRSVGLRVVTFGSVAEFLDANLPLAAAVLFSIFGCPGRAVWIWKWQLVQRTFAFQSFSSQALATYQCRYGP